MADQNPQDLYDKFYYATGCGLPYQRDEHWTTFFGRIADELVATINPPSMLDAGCALGLLVEQLRLRGVQAEGVDISEFAITNAPEAVRPFVRVGSVAEPFGRRYDLIICIEVLEHMSREDAERAVANFCAHSDDVIFSSSPLDFKEATHFNVHPIEHWADLFARHSFVRDVDFDASFLTPWTIRFRRSSEPPHRVIRNYERRFWELWKANTDLRELALEQRKELGVATDSLAHLNISYANLEVEHERLRSVLAEHQQSIQAYRREVNSREVVYKRLEEERKLYISRLEADLAQKIAHIGSLKALITRLESGRLLHILRTLERLCSKIPVPPRRKV